MNAVITFHLAPPISSKRVGSGFLLFAFLRFHPEFQIIACFSGSGSI